MSVIQTPDYFGSSFAQAFNQASLLAERARREEEERKRNEQSWNKFADTFVPQQPTDVQSVPVATSPIPGQSGNTQEPSAPVQAPTTTNEQVNMPSKNPYKQLEYQTGKDFAAKLQSMSQLQPQERQMAMRQLWNERESTLANARYDQFNTEISDLMGSYNPQDRLSEVQTKAKVVSIAKKYKIDPQDALKLFDRPKPIVVGGSLVDPDTYKELYRAPEKPDRVSANTIYTQQQENERARIRAQNQEPKVPEWEKEHHNYEKGIGVTDAQLAQKYWAEPDSIEAKDQPKYNAATARLNGYLSQRNLTADEQQFLRGIDSSKVSKEEGFKMLQQYRMNKLNGIRE